MCLARNRLLTVAAAWAVLVAPVPAADVVRPAPGEFLSRHELEVRFRDGLRIRLRDGEPKDIAPGGRALRDARSMAVVAGLRERGAKWRRTHEGVDEEILDALTRGRTRGSRDPRPLRDLNLYYRLSVSRTNDLDALALSIAELDDVAAVYRVPLPAPPPAILHDLASPTNASGVWQRYLDAAPTGIDARYAWSNGLAAAGIKICDIEYDWNPTHADLPPVLYLGSPRIPTEWADHGTAVLGQMAGIHNTNGVRGIAYGAAFRLASPYTSADGYNVSAAITAALTNLVAGDVILIEQQITGPNSAYVPIE